MIPPSSHLSKNLVPGSAHSSQELRQWPWVESLLHALCLFILWLMADGVAFYLRTPDHVSIWYPPSGLSLAFLAYFGWRFAPFVFLAKLASVFIYWRGDVNPVQWIPAIIFTTVLSTAEAYVLSLVLGHAEKLRAFRFTLCVIAIAFFFPAAKATLFTAFLYGTGVIDQVRLMPTFFVFWGGDAVGNLSFTLFFLLIYFPWQDRLVARWRGRWMGQQLPMPQILGSAALTWWQWLLEMMLLLGLLTCIKWQLPGEQHRFWYLMIYPLLAMTLRTGLRGAAIFVPMISFALVLAEALSPSGAGAIYIQIFFATIAALGLMAGALVTEQRDVTEQFAELKKTLDAANETKSRFLTSVAEEIRAPLQRIVLGQPHVPISVLPGMTNVPPREDRPAFSFHELEEQGDLLLERLQGLINGLHAADTPLKTLTLVDLAALADRQMANLADFAMSCGVTIRPPRWEAPLGIRTDAGRFEQGMNYLLQAAIRLGQGTAISLSCHRETHGAMGMGLLTVSIARLAPDIPTGWLRRLFNNWEPVDIDYVPPGSVLGLVLGKYLLEELGVALNADIQYFGSGLKLSMRVPLADAKGA